MVLNRDQNMKYKSINNNTDTPILIDLLITLFIAFTLLVAEEISIN